METDTRKVSLAGLRAFNNVEHGGRTNATFLFTLKNKRNVGWCWRRWLMEIKLHSTSCNIVAKWVQYVRFNNVGWCCINMLDRYCCSWSTLSISAKNGEFSSVNNDYILEDSSDFFYPMAQMFMRTVPTSSSVDMLTCSDEVQPSTALFYIASQQPRKTEVNIHLTEIPRPSTLVFPPSKILIFFNKIQEKW